MGVKMCAAWWSWKINFLSIRTAINWNNLGNRETFLYCFDPHNLILKHPAHYCFKYLWAYFYLSIKNLFSIPLPSPCKGTYLKPFANLKSSVKCFYNELNGSNHFPFVLQVFFKIRLVYLLFKLLYIYKSWWGGEMRGSYCYWVVWRSLDCTFFRLKIPLENNSF